MIILPLFRVLYQVSTARIPALAGFGYSIGFTIGARDPGECTRLGRHSRHTRPLRPIHSRWIDLCAGSFETPDSFEAQWADLIQLQALEAWLDLLPGYALLVPEGSSPSPVDLSGLLWLHSSHTAAA